MIEIISAFANMLSGTFNRPRMPESAKPRSPLTICCRGQQGIGFMIVLFMLLCCLGSQSHAAENLECPEIGPGRVPDLIGDATGSGLVTTGNRVELANEINYLINKLQISDPINLFISR
jgi:hypothetical protein